MGCQRGVTRHPDNPPFNAYADSLTLMNYTLKSYTLKLMITCATVTENDLCFGQFILFFHLSKHSEPNQTQMLRIFIGTTLNSCLKDLLYLLTKLYRI